MSYLLMPARLLMPAIRDVDLRQWRELYRLRDTFQVTITALKIRLEKLNLLYVTDDKKIYPSKQECHGQRRMM